MRSLSFYSGLSPSFPTADLTTEAPVDASTDEAAIRPQKGRPPRIRVLLEEGAKVAQGGPVACLRDTPDVQFVAPMSGTVARLSLLAGHRLSEIVIFREKDGEPMRHDVDAAISESALRRLMQRAGMWPWLRRRPFGGMPTPEERPTAIFVTAADTRPFAPDPVVALQGRDEAFARGLRALSGLTEGPVFLVVAAGSYPIGKDMESDRVRMIECGHRHPHGLPGFQIHRHFPAGLEHPVWDIHAEDVAALGDLLETGILPMTRLVRVAGEALRESRVVKTQIGADLRGLTHRIAAPGAHVLLAGSPIDGRAAHWLGPRDRQVTVLSREPGKHRSNWLVAALTRTARPNPVIPNAALTQAFGSALPAAAFVRSLTSGDDETAMKMGLLSLLEEDMALADYVLGGEAQLAASLRAMLERIRMEFAA